MLLRGPGMHRSDLARLEDGDRGHSGGARAGDGPGAGAALGAPAAALVLMTFKSP